MVKMMQKHNIPQIISAQLIFTKHTYWSRAHIHLTRQQEAGCLRLRYSCVPYLTPGLFTNINKKANKHAV